VSTASRRNVRGLRRSPHLVLYWGDGGLVVQNYATRRSAPASAFLLQVLEHFGTSRRVESLLRLVPREARAAADDLVGRLVEEGWLWPHTGPSTAADREFLEWGVWNPAAGFFHAATKDTEFVGLDEALVDLGRQAKSWPMPPPVKRYDGARTIPLPRVTERDRYTDVLRGRRTWRRFGEAPVPLQKLSALLDLSAGVQAWAVADGEGRVPLKTSPSGGARHPIEVYVAARHVDGLDPGVYHYAADAHVLEAIGRDLPPFDELLPTQSWYRDAAALVFFTAVFERTRWRYHSPRAYRAVLIEAGHVCQTFCLTATWLELAPFCSMAIADSPVEQILGIDGVSESVLYAAGVGTRPFLDDRTTPGMLPEKPA